MSKDRTKTNAESQTVAPEAFTVPAGSAVPAEEGAPPLIDVLIQKPGLRRSMLVIGLIGATAGTTSFLVMRGSSPGMSGLLARAACTGILVAVGLTVAKRFGQKRLERRIAGMTEGVEDEGIASLAWTIAYQEVGLTRKQPVSEMVRCLARSGWVERTIRLQWSQPLERIEPLTVAFEPRPLNEADPTFEEIEAATAPAAEEDDRARAQPAPTQRDDVLAARRIRRNLLLKGGWFAAGIFALFFLIAVWKSYQRGMVTWEVMFWGALLLLTLYGPVTGGFFGTRQWLLVPGGVVIRKARPGDRTCKVHLFDRRTSVLSAHELRRRIWVVTAADTEAYETTIGTKKEVRLLLRAWLSPLPPPSTAQLGDLAGEAVCCSFGSQ